MTKIKYYRIKFTKAINRFYSKIKPLYRKAKKYSRRHPGTSFGITLAVLLLLIVAGNMMRSLRPAEPPSSPPVKMVDIYAIGQAPTLRLEGKVEKSGVITIVAQTAGIVRRLNVTSGQKVSQGTTLLDISSNYRGSNLPALQQNLALRQYRYNRDNLEKQKEIIGLQKSIAEKNAANADELRQIGRTAVSESQSQLELTETILSTLNTNLATLEAATQSAENDALVLSTRQLKAQFLAAANQLRQLIRTNEYQSAEDQPPSQLADLQKQLTLNQLDLQEKSLELNLEVSRLNSQIAQVAASLMFPASPVSATVEQIHVLPFRSVSPGQPLVTLSGASEQLVLTAAVSPEVGRRLSRLEPAKVFLGPDTLTVTPQHLTTQPLDGQYRLIYHLPPQTDGQVFDGEYLTLEVPLGYADSVAALPSVPIDAVYQLEGVTTVFVAVDGLAVSREIKLGQVLGSYVEVLSGLEAGDLLITTRNVNSGQRVEYRQ